MDAPKHYHPNEVSQRKTIIISYHLYVESLKNDTNELIYRRDQTHRHRKQTWLSKGKYRQRTKLGVWD